MDLKNQILNYRATNNISQKDFAKKCKLTEQTICNIENGKQKPSKLTIIKIKKVLED